MQTTQIKSLLTQAKKLAVEYKKLTGKPLGITGEIGEFTAASLLGLELCTARQEGYDAIGKNGEKIQIKARCLKEIKGNRLSKLSVKHEWDYVYFVWLDENYEPVSIHSADRKKVLELLNVGGSKARNERKQLSARKFINESRKIWPMTGH